MLGRRKKKPLEVNLLELIPKRMVDHEIDETTIVTLLVPRFKNKLLKKWIEPRVKRRYLKVKLDEIGGAVWLLCDGQKNVKEIASVLREQFQEKIEPCYDRLGMFFQQLEQTELICYLNLEECRKVRNY